MKKATAICLLLLAAGFPRFATALDPEASITVGSHPLAAEEAWQEVPIYGWGWDNDLQVNLEISQMTLTAMIGNDGPKFQEAQPGSPSLFYDVMIDGSVWEGNNTGGIVELPTSAEPNQYFIGSIITEHVGTPPDVTPTTVTLGHGQEAELLVTLLVDTSGLTEGTWDLTLIPAPDTALITAEYSAGPPPLWIHEPVPDDDFSIYYVSLTIVSQSFTSADSANWNVGSTWTPPSGPPPPPAVPNEFYHAAVGAHTVTVAADAEAFSLTINDPDGKVEVTNGNLAEIVHHMDVTNGTLQIDYDGEVEVAGDATIGGSGVYACEVGQTDCGLISVADELVLDPGSALEFLVTGASKFEAGDYTLATYDSVTGTFASPHNLDAYACAGGLDYGTDELVLTIAHDLLVGDTDLDGDVDSDDYVALKLKYGTLSGALWSWGDTDGDGDVDSDDYVGLKLAYGSSVPGCEGGALAGGGNVNSVPEPGTLALVFMAAACMLLGYRGMKRAAGKKGRVL